MENGQRTPAGQGEGQAQNPQGESGSPQNSQSPTGAGEGQDNAAQQGAAVDINAFEGDEPIDLGDGKMTWAELVAAGKERLKGSGSGRQQAQDEGSEGDPRDAAILGLTKEVFDMKASSAISKFPNATVREIRARLLELPPNKRDFKLIDKFAEEIHAEIEDRVKQRHERYIQEKSEAARKDIGGGGAGLPSSDGSNKPITLDDTAELTRRTKDFLSKK